MAAGKGEKDLYEVRLIKIYFKFNFRVRYIKVDLSMFLSNHTCQWYPCRISVVMFHAIAKSSVQKVCVIEKNRIGERIKMKDVGTQFGGELYQ